MHYVPVCLCYKALVSNKRYSIAEAAKELGITRQKHCDRRESPLRRLKILIQLSTVLVIASCSDHPPQGWTLWIHTYSVVESDSLSPRSDDWSSFDTYLSRADCEKQIEPHLSFAEKNYQEEGTSKDYKLTIEREKQGLRVIYVPVKESKDEKTIGTTRFFCLPLGQDPRPKDPLTWTLWRHEATRGDRISYDSWQPEDSYLTGWQCMQAQHWQQQIVRPYNEESRKVGKGQQRTSTYFTCAPSTVNPWGKEG